MDIWFCHQIVVGPNYEADDTKTKKAKKSKQN
jgi:hypothetical protein